MPGIQSQREKSNENALENLLRSLQSDWPKKQSTYGRQMQSVPKAYLFKDIYEERKQKLQRQQLELERSQRRFQSRPMPNFRQVHQQLVNRQLVHRITQPVTPNVLRSTSCNMLHKQCKEQLNAKTKSATLPLLKPSNTQRSCTDPKPFRLSTEIRAQERKRFNMQSQQLKENRRQQLEEERNRRNLLEQQRLRQLATFRARPNPFQYQLMAR